MVFIYTTLPLFLALASVMNNPSLVLMGVLVVSVLLLMLRSGALAVFFYNNPDGGLVILLRMYLLFCLPLWLLFGSAIAALMASKWSVVAMLFVAAKVVNCLHLPALDLIPLPPSLSLAHSNDTFLVAFLNRKLSQFL